MKLKFISTSILALIPLFVTVRANSSQEFSTAYMNLPDVETMYVTYHKNINSLFNTAIQHVINGDGVVETSSDERKQDQLCNNPNNVATICIGLKAQFELRGYKQALLNVSDNPKVPLFKNVETPTSPLGQNDIITTKSDFIKDEIWKEEEGQGADALDATLDFYNEFMSAYSVHKDNLAIITSMANYNKKMAELRTKSYSLPGKFHNATTTGGSCT